MSERRTDGEVAVMSVLGIRVMSVAAAIVLVAYVVIELAGADPGSSAVALRVVVLAAAVVVAAIAFQSWQHGNTLHTASAVVLGLLGGASLASTVTTAEKGELYGSDPMALVGTLAVVAAVTVAQIGQTRAKAASR
jgi:hypothetical protein